MTLGVEIFSTQGIQSTPAKTQGTPSAKTRSAQGT